MGAKAEILACIGSGQYFPQQHAVSDFRNGMCGLALVLVLAVACVCRQHVASHAVLTCKRSMSAGAGPWTVGGLEKRWLFTRRDGFVAVLCFDADSRDESLGSKNALRQSQAVTPYPA